MDNFKTIYKILKYLEAALDYEFIDAEAISAKKLGISNTRLEQLLIILQESGYIKSVATVQTLGDKGPRIVGPIAPSITLKGLEYLAKHDYGKADNRLKDVTDITPGL